MKVNTIVNQNFKGILTPAKCSVVDNREIIEEEIPGTEKVIDGMREVAIARRTEGFVENHYDRSYYPFKNETKEQVTQAIAEYQSPGKKIYSVRDHATEMQFQNVTVKKALPFTKEQFMKYINYELLSKAACKISDSLVKRHLQCFLRENFVPNITKYVIK